MRQMRKWVTVLLSARHFLYIISLKHRKPWDLGKIVSTLQIRKLRPRKASWYGWVGHIEIELSWEFMSQTFCAVIVLWHQCFSAFTHPHVPNNRGESGTWRLAQSGWLQACNFVEPWAYLQHECKVFILFPPSSSVELMIQIYPLALETPA